jgi:hypothetical protein
MIFLTAELQGESQSWFSRPSEEHLSSDPEIAEAVIHDQHVGRQKGPQSTVEFLTETAVKAGFLVPYSQKPRQSLLRVTETYRDVKILLSRSYELQSVLPIPFSDQRYSQLWDVENDADASARSPGTTGQSLSSDDGSLPSNSAAEDNSNFSSWIHATSIDTVPRSGMNISSPRQ